MTAAAAPLSRGFDPEWPHGHEACIDGEFFPARILCTDLKFNRPVLAAILRDGEETCRAYRTDGTWYEDDRRHENFYLRNAPAPRASGTDWVVRGTTKEGQRAYAGYLDKADADALADIWRDHHQRLRAMRGSRDGCPRRSREGRGVK